MGRRVGDLAVGLAVETKPTIDGLTAILNLLTEIKKLAPNGTLEIKLPNLANGRALQQQLRQVPAQFRNLTVIGEGENRQVVDIRNNQQVSAERSKRFLATLDKIQPLADRINRDLIEQDQTVTATKADVRRISQRVKGMPAALNELMVGIETLAAGITEMTNQLGRLGQALGLKTNQIVRPSVKGPLGKGNADQELRQQQQNDAERIQLAGETLAKASERGVEGVVQGVKKSLKNVGDRAKRAATEGEREIDEAAASARAAVVDQAKPAADQARKALAGLGLRTGGATLQQELTRELARLSEVNKQEFAKAAAELDRLTANRTKPLAIADAEKLLAKIRETTQAAEAAQEAAFKEQLGLAQKNLETFKRAGTGTPAALGSEIRLVTNRVRDIVTKGFEQEIKDLPDIEGASKRGAAIRGLPKQVQTFTSQLQTVLTRLAERDVILATEIIADLEKLAETSTVKLGDIRNAIKKGRDRLATLEPSTATLAAEDLQQGVPSPLNRAIVPGGSSTRRGGNQRIRSGAPAPGPLFDTTIFGNQTQAQQASALERLQAFFGAAQPEPEPSFSVAAATGLPALRQLAQFFRTPPPPPGPAIAVAGTAEVQEVQHLTTDIQAKIHQLTTKIGETVKGSKTTVKTIVDALELQLQRFAVLQPKAFEEQIGNIGQAIATGKVSADTVKELTAGLEHVNDQVGAAVVRQARESVQNTTKAAAQAEEAAAAQRAAVSTRIVSQLKDLKLAPKTSTDVVNAILKELRILGEASLEALDQELLTIQKTVIDARTKGGRPTSLGPAAAERLLTRLKELNAIPREVANFFDATAVETAKSAQQLTSTILGEVGLTAEEIRAGAQRAREAEKLAGQRAREGAKAIGALPESIAKAFEGFRVGDTFTIPPEIKTSINQLTERLGVTLKGTTKEVQGLVNALNLELERLAVLQPEAFEQQIAQLATAVETGKVTPAAIQKLTAGLREINERVALTASEGAAATVKTVQESTNKALQDAARQQNEASKRVKVGLTGLSAPKVSTETLQAIQAELREIGLRSLEQLDEELTAIRQQFINLRNGRPVSSLTQSKAKELLAHLEELTAAPRQVVDRTALATAEASQQLLQAILRGIGFSEEEIGRIAARAAGEIATSQKKTAEAAEKLLRIPEALAKQLAKEVSLLVEDSEASLLKSFTNIKVTGTALAPVVRNVPKDLPRDVQEKIRSQAINAVFPSAPPEFAINAANLSAASGIKNIDQGALNRLVGQEILKAPATQVRDLDKAAEELGERLLQSLRTTLKIEEAGPRALKAFAEAAKGLIVRLQEVAQAELKVQSGTAPIAQAPVVRQTQAEILARVQAAAHAQVAPVHQQAFTEQLTRLQENRPEEAQRVLGVVEREAAESGRLTTNQIRELTKAVRGITELDRAIQNFFGGITEGLLNFQEAGVAQILATRENVQRDVKRAIESVHVALTGNIPIGEATDPIVRELSKVQPELEKELTALAERDVNAIAHFLAEVKALGATPAPGAGQQLLANLRARRQALEEAQAQLATAREGAFQTQAPAFSAAVGQEIDPARLEATLRSAEKLAGAFHNGQAAIEAFIKRSLDLKDVPPEGLKAIAAAAEEVQKRLNAVTVAEERVRQAAPPPTTGGTGGGPTPPAPPGGTGGGDDDGGDGKEKANRLLKLQEETSKRLQRVKSVVDKVGRAEDRIDKALTEQLATLAKIDPESFDKLIASIDVAIEEGKATNKVSPLLHPEALLESLKVETARVQNALGKAAEGLFDIFSASLKPALARLESDARVARGNITADLGEFRVPKAILNDINNGLKQIIDKDVLDIRQKVTQSLEGLKGLQAEGFNIGPILEDLVRSLETVINEKIALAAPAKEAAAATKRGIEALKRQQADVIFKITQQFPLIGQQLQEAIAAAEQQGGDQGEIARQKLVRDAESILRLARQFEGDIGRFFSSIGENIEVSFAQLRTSLGTGGGGLTKFDRALSELGVRFPQLVAQINEELGRIDKDDQEAIDAARQRFLRSINELNGVARKVAEVFDQFTGRVHATAEESLQTATRALQAVKTIQPRSPADLQKAIQNAGTPAATSTTSPRVTGTNVSLEEVTPAQIERIRLANKENQGLLGTLLKVRQTGPFLNRLFDGFIEGTTSATAALIRFQAGFLVFNAVFGTFQRLRQGFTQFTDELAKVAAITRAGTGEIALLGEKAREVGRTTSVSAVEAAHALQLLGQAGFDARESLGALDAVVRLAVGGASNLDQSVQLITATIRAFGLSTASADKIADIFLDTVNKSRATVEGLNTVFNFAGPAAAAAGLKVKDLAAVIAVLSNNGIKFSTQGTAIRNTLNNLVAPSAKAQQIFTALGLSLEQIDPVGKDFVKVLLQLRAAGFGVEQAFHAFGIRGATAVATLVRQAEAIEEVRSGLGRAGAALEAMDRAQRSVTAQSKITSQQFTDIGIAIGQDFEPAIVGFLGLAQKAISGIAGLRTALESLAAALLAISLIRVAGPSLLTTLGATAEDAAKLAGSATLFSGLGLAIGATVATLLVYFNARKQATEVESAAIQETQQQVESLHALTASLAAAGLSLKDFKAGSLDEVSALNEIDTATRKLILRFPDLEERFKAIREAARAGQDVRPELRTIAVQAPIDEQIRTLEAQRRAIESRLNTGVGGTASGFGSFGAVLLDIGRESTIRGINNAIEALKNVRAQSVDAGTGVDRLAQDFTDLQDAAKKQDFSKVRELDELIRQGSFDKLKTLLESFQQSSLFGLRKVGLGIKPEEFDALQAAFVSLSRQGKLSLDALIERVPDLKKIFDSLPPDVRIALKAIVDGVAEADKATSDSADQQEKKWQDVQQAILSAAESIEKLIENTERAANAARAGASAFQAAIRAGATLETANREKEIAAALSNFEDEFNDKVKNAEKAFKDFTGGLTREHLLELTPGEAGGQSHEPTQEERDRFDRAQKIAQDIDALFAKHDEGRAKVRADIEEKSRQQNFEKEVQGQINLDETTAQIEAQRLRKRGEIVAAVNKDFQAQAEKLKKTFDPGPALDKELDQLDKKRKAAVAEALDDERKLEVEADRRGRAAAVEIEAQRLRDIGDFEGAAEKIHDEKLREIDEKNETEHLKQKERAAEEVRFEQEKKKAAVDTAEFKLRSVEKEIAASERQRAIEERVLNLQIERARALVTAGGRVPIFGQARAEAAVEEAAALATLEQHARNRLAQQQDLDRAVREEQALEQQLGGLSNQQLEAAKNLVETQQDKLRQTDEQIEKDKLELELAKKALEVKVNFGSQFENAITQGLENLRTGAGNPSDIIKGLGDGIAQELEQGFAKALVKKIGFDHEFVLNMQGLGDQAGGLISGGIGGGLDHSANLLNAFSQNAAGSFGDLGKLFGSSLSDGATTGFSNANTQANSFVGSLTNLLGLGGLGAQAKGAVQPIPVLIQAVAGPLPVIVAGGSLLGTGGAALGGAANALTPLLNQAGQFVGITGPGLPSIPLNDQTSLAQLGQTNPLAQAQQLQQLQLQAQQLQQLQQTAQPGGFFSNVLKLFGGGGGGGGVAGGFPGQSGFNLASILSIVQGIKTLSTPFDLGLRPGLVSNNQFGQPAFGNSLIPASIANQFQVPTNFGSISQPLQSLGLTGSKLLLPLLAKQFPFLAKIPILGSLLFGGGGAGTFGALGAGALGGATAAGQALGGGIGALGGGTLLTTAAGNTVELLGPSAGFAGTGAITGEAIGAGTGAGANAGAGAGGLAGAAGGLAGAASAVLAVVGAIVSIATAVKGVLDTTKALKKVTLNDPSTERFKVGSLVGVGLGAGIGTGVGAAVGTAIFPVFGTIIGAAIGAALGATLAQLVSQVVGSAVGKATLEARKKGLNQDQLEQRINADPALRGIKGVLTSGFSELGDERKLPTAAKVIFGILNPLYGLVQLLQSISTPNIELIFNKLFVKLFQAASGIQLNRQLTETGSGLRGPKDFAARRDILATGGSFARDLVPLLSGISGAGSEATDRIQRFFNILVNSLAVMHKSGKEALQIFEAVLRVLGSGDLFKTLTLITNFFQPNKNNQPPSFLRLVQDTAQAFSKVFPFTGLAGTANTQGILDTFIEGNFARVGAPAKKASRKVVTDAIGDAFSANTFEEGFTGFLTRLKDGMQKAVTDGLTNAFVTHGALGQTLDRFFADVNKFLRQSLRGGRKAEKAEDRFLEQDLPRDLAQIGKLLDSDKFGRVFENIFLINKQISDKIEQFRVDFLKRTDPAALDRERQTAFDKIIGAIVSAVQHVQQLEASLHEFNARLLGKIHDIGEPNQEPLGFTGRTDTISSEFLTSAQNQRNLFEQNDLGNPAISGEERLRDLQGIETAADNFVQARVQAITAHFGPLIDAAQKAKDAFLQIHDQLLQLRTSREAGRSPTRSLELIQSDIREQQAILRAGFDPKHPERQLQAAQRLQNLFQQQLQIAQASYDTSGPRFRSIERATERGLQEVQDIMQAQGKDLDNLQDQQTQEIKQAHADALDFYTYVRENGLRAITDAQGDANNHLTDIYAAISDALGIQGNPGTLVTALKGKDLATLTDIVKAIDSLKEDRNQTVNPTKQTPEGAQPITPRALQDVKRANLGTTDVSTAAVETHAGNAFVGRSHDVLNDQPGKNKFFGLPKTEVKDDVDLAVHNRLESIHNKNHPDLQQTAAAIETLVKNYMDTAILRIDHDPLGFNDIANIAFTLRDVLNHLGGNKDLERPDKSPIITDDVVNDILNNFFNQLQKDVKKDKAIQLAEGGIATSPTRAVIGEGGYAEAVVPLTVKGLRPFTDVILKAIEQSPTTISRQLAGLINAGQAPTLNYQTLTQIIGQLQKSLKPPDLQPIFVKLSDLVVHAEQDVATALGKFSSGTVDAKHIVVGPVSEEKRHFGALLEKLAGSQAHVEAILAEMSAALKAAQAAPGALALRPIDIPLDRAIDAEDHVHLHINEGAIKIDARGTPEEQRRKLDRIPGDLLNLLEREMTSGRLSKVVKKSAGRT